MTSSPSRSQETISFAGISVQPKTLHGLMAVVAGTIANSEKCVIANHNLHSLYLFHREARMRNFYRDAAWTHIDGMPLIALARLYGHRLQRAQRVTYVDWTGPLMEAAAQGKWRVFYLGSKPGIGEQGAAILRRRYRHLHIETMSGYFDADNDSADNERVLGAIDAYRPNLLMVGMGMPRQELWIHENFGRLNANVMLPCGAAIDYVAGAVSTPPRWTGQLGLEWAYRFAQEPERLWRRYLVEPWFVLKVVGHDLFRQRFKIRAVPLTEEE